MERITDWVSGEAQESSLDSNSSTSPVNESQYFSDAIVPTAVPNSLTNLLFALKTALTAQTNQVPKLKNTSVETNASHAHQNSSNQIDTTFKISFKLTKNELTQEEAAQRVANQ